MFSFLLNIMSKFTHNIKQMSKPETHWAPEALLPRDRQVPTRIFQDRGRVAMQLLDARMNFPSAPQGRTFDNSLVCGFKKV